MAAATRFFQTCLGVFQGGGCRSAAFVGAYEEARRRGVSFAGVAGASAGSIVAALLGAGATSERLRDTVLGLEFTSFMASPERLPSTPKLASILPATRFGSLATIWCYQGLHSSAEIERWINGVLSEILPGKGRHVRFRDLPIPTWVVATDIVTRDVKVWSTWATPEDEVGFAVRCSCSIPGVFQPVANRYVDGGVLSNLPAFVFQHVVRSTTSSLSTRILAFNLSAASELTTPTNARQAALALVDTVVDGAANVQQRMTDTHVIDIPTGAVRATDFEAVTADVVAGLVENGRNATKSFFDDELAKVRATRDPTDLLEGQDEVYAAVTEKLTDGGVQDIWIVDQKTRWLYAIYPSILYWLINNVRVTVLWQRDNFADMHEQLRRRILRVMGARIVEVPQVTTRAFLFDAQDSARGAAVVYIESLSDGSEVRARKYQAPLDTAVIRSLQSTVEGVGGEPTESVGLPALHETTSDELLRRLRRYVLPYAGSEIHLEVNKISLIDLISMSKVVKGFKYQQIGYLEKLFVRRGLRPFQLAVVRYADGTETIVTPAVVEAAGTRQVLIQGNTRATYCYKKRIEEIDCVMVRNVSVPLPSNQRIPVEHMLIGDRTLTVHDRYGADIDRDYRQIELASHHPEVTLR